ncbi:MAG: hypothetical protein H5T74_07960 [Actinobacteria bacterium]|nr:hypothetical protein [Actinomycetota bacterium]
MAVTMAMKIRMARASRSKARPRKKERRKTPRRWSASTPPKALSLQKSETAPRATRIASAAKKAEEGLLKTR